MSLWGSVMRLVRYSQVDYETLETIREIFLEQTWHGTKDNPKLELGISVRNRREGEPRGRYSYQLLFTPDEILSFMVMMTPEMIRQHLPTAMRYESQAIDTFPDLLKEMVVAYAEAKKKLDPKPTDA
jgi:hypothetical protein